MNKLPLMYDEIQSDEIQNFINENFGDGNGYIAHEIESEYVHTDSMLIAPDGCSRTFVTFGMGAREMSSPTDFKRTELVMSASKEMEVMSEKGFIISGELAGLSKFPFSENTWFGPGHTIGASKKFKEAFGYGIFAFKNLWLKTRLSNIDEDIHFLSLVPIHEEERQWCMDNNTNVFLDKLYDEYGDDIFNVDFKRDVFIPETDEDELFDYQMMTMLNINRETYAALNDYLEEAEQNGEKITLELIEKWVKENT